MTCPALWRVLRVLGVLGVMGRDVLRVDAKATWHAARLPRPAAPWKRGKPSLGWLCLAERFVMVGETGERVYSTAAGRPRRFGHGAGHELAGGQRHSAMANSVARRLSRGGRAIDVRRRWLRAGNAARHVSTHWCGTGLVGSDGRPSLPSVGSEAGNGRATLGWLFYLN